jgi:hypothetical protein
MTDSQNPYGWYAPADPAAYEQACLEAVRRGLGDVESDPGYRFVPKRIHDIRLQGSYPDTELVVDVSRGSERAQLTWELHGDAFGTPQAPGYQEPPEGVAQQVYIQVLEFGN